MLHRGGFSFEFDSKNGNGCKTLNIVEFAHVKALSAFPANLRRHSHQDSPGNLLRLGRDFQICLHLHLVCFYTALNSCRPKYLDRVTQLKQPLTTGRIPWNDHWPKLKKKIRLIDWPG